MQRSTRSIMALRWSNAPSYLSTSKRRETHPSLYAHSGFVGCM